MGLIIALIMIVIAYQQLQEVRQECVASRQALDRAYQAEKAAISVAENLGEVKAKVEECYEGHFPYFERYVTFIQTF
jgi:DNA-binding transcriptional regulator PaaX